jgi:hypothetical protein
MRLIFSTVNSAWLFMFGSSPCRMGDYPMFFQHRWEAVEAARAMGLTVNQDSTVEVSK